MLPEDTLSTLAASAGLGLALGLRFRVPAVLLASAAVAVVVSAAAALAGNGPLAALTLSSGAVAALQCGYLGGLLLAYATGRAKVQRNDEPTL